MLGKSIYTNGIELLQYLEGGVSYTNLGIDILLFHNINHYLLILYRNGDIEQNYYVETVWDLYESDYLIKKMYDIEGFIKASCNIKGLDYDEYWQLRNDLIDIIIDENT